MNGFRLIVAEKPSLARDIARVLGIRGRGDRNLGQNVLARSTGGSSRRKRGSRAARRRRGSVGSRNSSRRNTTRPEPPLAPQDRAISRFNLSSRGITSQAVAQCST